MADGAQMLGSAVVAFARSQLGRQVGDGECYTLADRALQHAKAKSAPSYGVISEDADYVWGTPIALKDAMPGDILQFRDFVSTIKVTRTSEDGASSWSTQEYEAPHHTAVVEHNLKNGEIILLEQGKGSGRRVRRITVAIYANSFDDTRKGTTTSTSTSVGEGTVTAYRPRK